MGKPLCELPKNSREVYQFRLSEYRGHKFVDLRIFTIEPGEKGEKPRDPAPSKKGLTIAPHLWPQFRQALARVETAMIEQGWLDREDLG